MDPALELREACTVIFLSLIIEFEDPRMHLVPCGQWSEVIVNQPKILQIH